MNFVGCDRTLIGLYIANMKTIYKVGYFVSWIVCVKLLIILIFKCKIKSQIMNIDCKIDVFIIVLIYIHNRLIL